MTKLFYISIDEELTGSINLSQSGPGSNVNEGVIHTFQSSRIGLSTSDAV